MEVCQDGVCLGQGLDSAGVGFEFGSGNGKNGRSGLLGLRESFL